MLGMTQAVGQVGVQRHMLVTTATASGLPLACQIDDHRAHCTRCIAQEVLPVGELQLVGRRHLQVALMHQDGGVDQHIALVARQPRPRQPAQIRVERPQQVICGMGIAVDRTVNQGGDVHRLIMPPDCDPKHCLHFTAPTHCCHDPDPSQPARPAR